ncbi:Acid stress chaperone HdeB [Azospirillaceae bacterium]
MKNLLKVFVFALFLVGVAVAAQPAFAGADDAKWVAQCVKDNSDEKASPMVVAKYCACMNDKMDNNETKSISEWEKTHTAERSACERESGWK